MNEYQQKRTRQAARRYSWKKLREQLKHTDSDVREIATQELKRRDTELQIQETHMEIIIALEPLDPSALTKNAVKIEVEASECEVNHFEIPYSYRAWWYNEECIAFAHNIPKDAADEWLEIIRGESRDGFVDEPVEAYLDLNRIFIYDIPLEHLVINTETYRVEFVRHSQ